MITSRLAYKQLSKNKKRTWITLLGIVLSVSMITAIAGFAESALDIFKRSYIAIGGDWHVVFAGVTEEDVETLGEDPRIENIYTELNDDRLDVKFRLINPDRNYYETMESVFGDNGISEEAGIGINSTLLMAEGVMDDVAATTILWFCGILIFIVVIGSMIVIANSFSISANERIRQFGLLKSAGATKEQIRRIVLAEALILAVISIPLGILTGFLMESIALEIANGLLRDAINVSAGFDGKLYVIISPAVILTAAAVSFFTIVASAWLPAGKAAGISAIDAIKLSKEIRIKPKKVKASRLIGKLFGIEGVLADKSLKRASGKYRATVVSLVTSMVLFIGGMSFTDYLSKSFEIFYLDFGIYAGATVYSKNVEELTKTVKKIHKTFEDGTLLSYSVIIQSDDIGGILGDAFKQAGGTDVMRVHSVSDARFEQLCESLRIKDNAEGGVLVNTLSVTENGTQAEIKPAKFREGMAIGFGGDNKREIILTAETDEIPKDILLGFGKKLLNVVVSESMFRQVFMEGDLMATVTALNINAGEFTDKASEIISEMEDGEAGYSMMNVEREAMINRNISQLAKVFILGFVGLLSLIAVTSVIGTISTGMSLRRQEFAILQSVGMSRRELRRAVNYESLLYGIKALVFGIPLGVLVSWLFYQAISASLAFGFIFPWRGVLICVAAVFLITFGTMRFGISRLEKHNIAEALKMEA